MKAPANNFVTSCPACSSALEATRLSCVGCGTQLEGHFGLPALLRLSPQDLDFVTRFVQHSGSLKAIAEAESVSYPTVRNRLNNIIKQLEQAAQTQRAEQHRHDVLDALERKEMSVEQAIKALRRGGAAR